MNSEAKTVPGHFCPSPQTRYPSPSGLTRGSTLLRDLKMRMDSRVKPDYDEVDYELDHNKTDQNENITKSRSYTRSVDCE